MFLTLFANQAVKGHPGKKCAIKDDLQKTHRPVCFELGLLVLWTDGRSSSLSFIFFFSSSSHKRCI